MPTTRRPLARKRNASFTPEVLRLFLELENSPRRGKRFEADGRRLMQLLGLSEHWWTGNSVLNHDPVPSPPRTSSHGTIFSSVASSASNSWLRAAARCRNAATEPAARARRRINFRTAPKPLAQI